MREKKREKKIKRQRAGDGKMKRWKNRVWERSGKRVSREKGRGRPARKKPGFSARELDSKAVRIL